MTPERYQQIADLYHAALERPPEERAEFLQRASGADQALRSEVESLLAGGDSAEGFLLSRAMKEATKKLSNEESFSLIGKRLGHYQILSLLGTGGMGEVYLARDAKLGREVAIKLLPQAFSSAQHRLRLEREARAASALNHPNIVTIYEIGQLDEQHFIAVEFIDGETLREILQMRSLKLEEVLEIAIQVASALSAAHATGIVHRDIKPENIMLRRDGLVKVLDFGLAKLNEPQAALSVPEGSTLEWLNTESGVVLGTPAYMSPEQTRGLPVDARTDIWSLGVVLYEMVAGRVPFAGPTRSDVIVSILERDPPEIAGETREVSAALDSIIEKALRKERSERYQTAAELLSDLKNLRPGFDPRTTASHSVATQKSRWFRQHRNGVMLTLGLLIISVAGIALSLYKFRETITSPPVLPRAKIVPFTSFPGRELQPAFSPDGDQIAFAWNGEKGDNFDIYLKPKDAGAPPLKLTNNRDDDLYPTWSPDGHYIAFVRQSGTQISIFTIPVLGGPERKLYSGTSAFFSLYEYGNALSWSPDGKYLAFSQQGSPGASNSIFLLSIETLERRQVTLPPAGFLGDSTPAFSPDGKTLAFFRWTTVGPADV